MSRTKVLEWAATVLLSAIGVGVGLSTIPKWIAFALAYGLLLHLLSALPYFAEVPTKLKLFAAVFLFLFGAGCASGFVAFQYRAEQAAKTSGRMTAGTRNDGRLPPVFEIGTSGRLIEWAGKQPVISLWADSRIKLENINGEMTLTTEVRDSADHLVVTVDKNVWTIAPGNSWDKNYTDDSLEVKDSGGRVVLQVQILQDRIRLQGEWHGPLGNRLKIVEHDGGAEMITGTPGEPEHINPMFAYPSSACWAIWRTGAVPPCDAD